MTHTAKHTPGPWYPHYAKADHCLSSSVWGREPGNQVAVIGGKSLETMNANAALIAAAPAMYEALKFLTSEIDLSKLNVRKDFSLMNAHAWAVKVILQAEGKLL